VADEPYVPQCLIDITYIYNLRSVVKIGGRDWRDSATVSHYVLCGDELAVANISCMILITPRKHQCVQLVPDVC
jgi:hypothetical protein